MTVTAVITNDHNPPTHYVVCPVCSGRVAFNLAEIEARRSRGMNTSIYCAGRDHTTGGQDPHNHWHPNSPWEAGEIREFHWAEAEP